MIRSICRLVLVAMAASGPGGVHAQPFTLQLVDPQVPELSYGRLALADLNGDGFMDLAALGNAERSVSNAAEPRAVVAINGSAGSYGTRIPFETVPLPQDVWHGTPAWTDFDGDDVLDVVVTGSSTNGSPLEGGILVASTTLYRGTGDGWVAVPDDGLLDLYAGTASWADVDMDGDQDLLLTGLDTDEVPHTRLYRNVGGDLVDMATTLPDRALGEVAWADLDGDSDLDLLLSGIDGTGGFHVGLYRNDGAGGFSLVDSLDPLAFVSADWGDYDGDGDPDLLLSGARLSYRYQLLGVTRLYRNDGGTLVLEDAGLAGALYGSVRWADYDNDGRLDILVNGLPRPGSGRVGFIYRNEGGFRHSAQFLGTVGGNAEWADLDGDGDLDLAVTGSDLRAAPVLYMMRNESRIVNNDPHPPGGLSSSAQAGRVTLAWQSGEDDETATSTLSYNLHVRDAAGRTIMPSFSDTETGARRLPEPGNAGYALEWTLTGLAPGTYDWAVQTVDTSFRGSAFTSGQPFTVTAGAIVGTAADDGPELPDRFAVEAAWPNPFVGGTAFVIRLPEAVRVIADVFDMRGRHVAAVHDGVLGAGVHSLAWRPGSEVAAGVYHVRVWARGSLLTLPVIRVR